MTDARLRKNVIDELQFDPAVNAGHIKVAVAGGVVTLTGHVRHYAEKAAAAKAVQRVKGARAIADDIEVIDGADVDNTDSDIAQRVVSMLDWDILVPARAIHVVVRHGWVTLSGSVDWNFERSSAEEDVRKLAGVRGVINQIQIQPKVRAENVRSRIEAALRRHAEVEASAVRVSITGDSVVRLEGKVGSIDERAAAREAAWSAPGVTVVEDCLLIA